MGATYWHVFPERPVCHDRNSLLPRRTFSGLPKTPLDADAKLEIPLKSSRFSMNSSSPELPKRQTSFSVQGDGDLKQRNALILISNKFRKQTRTFFLFMDFHSGFHGSFWQIDLDIPYRLLLSDYREISTQVFC